MYGDCGWGIIQYKFDSKARFSFPAGPRQDIIMFFFFFNPVGMLTDDLILALRLALGDRDYRIYANKVKQARGLITGQHHYGVVYLVVVFFPVSTT